MFGPERMCTGLELASLLTPTSVAAGQCPKVLAHVVNVGQRHPRSGKHASAPEDLDKWIGYTQEDTHALH
jgi:hypothetical protein